MAGTSFRGCTHLADTAFAFDALAAEVGMTPRVAFVDVTVPALDPALPPTVAPWCHAVIYAVTTTGKHRRAPPPPLRQPDYDGADGATDEPVLRLRPDMAQIADVYAFLHAVFNCNIPKAIVPGSTIDRLRAACSEQPLGLRTGVLKKAVGLQRAYRKTVAKAPWGLAGPNASAAGAAAAAAAGSSSSSPPRYFVFVRSHKGGLYLIDGDRLSEIESGRPPEATSTVLTETVLAKLRELHETYGAGEAASVIGILERLC